MSDLPRTCAWVEEDGRRYFVPACYGGIVAPEQCTCYDLQPKLRVQVEHLGDLNGRLRDRIDYLENEIRRLHRDARMSMVRLAAAEQRVRELDGRKRLPAVDLETP